METLQTTIQENVYNKFSSVMKKKNPTSLVISFFFIILSPLGTIPLLIAALVVSFQRLKYLKVLQTQLVKNQVL